MKLHFTKMHGTGNDFILINAMSSNIPELTKELAIRLCDRRFGVGADQILIVRPSNKADFRMEIINADGGIVEMCGNGIRCLAKFVCDHYLTTKTALTVETLGGLIKPEILLDHEHNSNNTTWVKVDMGEPLLEGRKIPVDQDGQVINKSFKLSKEDEFKITCVSMGNPHCIVFVDDVEGCPLELLGPQFENHAFFPNRVNTEFVQVIDKSNIKMRVWERGSGETLACGTGACAATVASILNKKTDRTVKVHLRGGNLDINWTNHVTMTGPATAVFDGHMNI